jgi:hypothetical protein
MNTLALKREDIARRRAATHAAPVTHYVASLAPGGGTTSMRFGEALNTTTVRHEAKAFSKEKVKRLSKRESSDDSDSGPCYSDYERTPGTKAGEKGSCRPKGKKKKLKTETSNASVIHKKGSDADGDGKTGEAAAADKKKKKKGWNRDDDKDGKPNAIDSDASTSSSDEEEKDTTKKK